MNDLGQVRALPGRAIHITREKEGWAFMVLERRGGELIDIGHRYGAENFDLLLLLIRKHVELEPAPKEETIKIRDHAVELGR